VDAIKKTDRKEPPKPYSKPTLTTYGTVREHTKSLGPTGMVDSGGTTGHTKTSLT
jgi:hypothetical protein